MATLCTNTVSGSDLAMRGVHVQDMYVFCIVSARARYVTSKKEFYSKLTPEFIPVPCAAII